MTRQRPRDHGIGPGIFRTGPENSITDVPGVRVGHLTLIEGAAVRTGVTAILPHGGNLYQDRVPAGLAVANGFGKLAGATQLQELGELETPILLTNTLAVPAAAAALIEWTLARPGNEAVRSVNPVVGETNDGFLNDIRAMAITPEHAQQALGNARRRPPAEGAVGAGTGTVCFGWKGGIGSSSRRLPRDLGGYRLGVLVQANFGGQLQLLGVPMAGLAPAAASGSGEGSIVIVVATDAPLADRNLRRLAWRSFAGVARIGGDFANGSGDYAIAFSTAETVRRTALRRTRAAKLVELPNELLSPLFQAAIEATEEAVYNALWSAESMDGFQSRTVHALPLEQVLRRLRQSGRVP
jgi:D-aminopeptidase